MTESCGLCRLPNITLPTWTLCGHCFCDACIRRHVARVPKCPVCDEVVLMADLATAPNAAHFGSAPDPADPVPAPPDISSSSTAHAPEVAPFGLPPDGPPPYSSTPQGNRVYRYTYIVYSIQLLIFRGYAFSYCAKKEMRKKKVY